MITVYAVAKGDEVVALFRRESDAHGHDTLMEVMS